MHDGSPDPHLALVDALAALAALDERDPRAVHAAIDAVAPALLRYERWRATTLSNRLRRPERWSALSQVSLVRQGRAALARLARRRASRTFPDPGATDLPGTVMIAGRCAWARCTRWDDDAPSLASGIVALALPYEPGVRVARRVVDGAQVRALQALQALVAIEEGLMVGPDAIDFLHGTAARELIAGIVDGSNVAFTDAFAEFARVLGEHAPGTRVAEIARDARDALARD
jgi:hypothetical protein